MIDTLSSDQWLEDCDSAELYFSYLEDHIVYGEDSSFVTYKRLDPILGCKSDCDFTDLLSVPSIFTSNCDPNLYTNCSTADFALHVTQYLPPDSASLCRVAFPALSQSVANISPTQLTSNISKKINKFFILFLKIFLKFKYLDQINFMAPSMLSTLSSQDSLLVAQSLGTKKLSNLMAKTLGSNIPSDTSPNNVASISSAIPLDCFAASSSNNARRRRATSSGSNLVSLLTKMDLNNMNSNRKTFISLQILALNDSNSISSMLNSTTDSSIVNSVPSFLFNLFNLNISSIPSTNLPTAYVSYCLLFNFFV